MKAKDFGKYIRKLRNDRELTIRQLELYSGVSNSYLSQLENGKRGTPSPEIIKKLAKGLKIPYNNLLEKAGYLDEPESDEYDPLAEIQKITDDLGIEDLAFYDIEKWKNFTPEDVEEIRNHFEYIAHRAKLRKKNDGG